jgi:hypothetical protein
MLEFSDPLGRSASDLAHAIAEALYPDEDFDVNRVFAYPYTRWQFVVGHDHWLYDMADGNFRIIPREADDESLAGLRLMLQKVIGVRVAD